MLIAEFCQNHLGKLDLLMDMVKTAKECGVHFCKIQSFFADDLDEDWEHDYKRLKSLELTWEEQAKFVAEVKRLGMTPMTSVYTRKYVPQLQKCGFQWIKIGSAQYSNQELIKTYVHLGYKVIVSTGGHNVEMYERLFPLSGVLHCNSKYPTQPNEANISRMLTLKYLWHGRTPIGYSSHIDPMHEKWKMPLQLASYLGASFIECHFTLLPREKTKDGAVSLDKYQLKEIADFDKLPSHEQLAKEPWLGLFKTKDSAEEKKLIDHYKSRWSLK